MSERTMPCVSCGYDVPQSQTAPYPGHAADCRLVREWQNDADLIPSSEHQRVLAELAEARAQAAAMREFLVRWHSKAAGCASMFHEWDALLSSSSAGADLLAELDDLRARVRVLTSDVDALNRTCCERNEDLKKADAEVRRVVEEAAKLVEDEDRYTMPGFTRVELAAAIRSRGGA